MVKALEKCFAEQAEALEKNDHHLSMEKDMEFHHIIIKAAHNTRIEEVLKTVMDQITMMAISVENDDEMVHSTLNQHRDILDAIENDDIAKAEECIENHIIMVKEYHSSRYYLL